MTIPSEVFTEMVTTTLRHRSGGLVDNVTKNNALLRYMKEHGNIKTDARGGDEIQVPLIYDENSTYQRYYGGEVLSVADSDVITSAKYDWKQVALNVTATGRELLLNNGKEKMIDLSKSRVKVAMATAANNMSIDVYSNGAIDNQIGGLEHIIQNTGAGTVGSIDSSVHTFWQNKTQELSAPGTFSALKGEMNKLWLNCVRGSDKPDLIVFTHDLYSTYEGGLQDLQRYGDSKAAGMGFEALKYKTASVIFDDNANFGKTAEVGYFLNTKHLSLTQHPDAQWTQDDKKSPINQDKTVIPIYWMGQMCCSNRSLQGKLLNAI